MNPVHQTQQPHDDASDRGPMLLLVRQDQVEALAADGEFMAAKADELGFLRVAGRGELVNGRWTAYVADDEVRRLLEMQVILLTEIKELLSR